MADDSEPVPDLGLELRLVGGATDSRGRLEVYHDEVWGTVCDDAFNDETVGVLCAILGYG